MFGGEDEDFSLVPADFSGLERPKVSYLAAVEFKGL